MAKHTEDQITAQTWIWHVREEVLDSLLFHTCIQNKGTAAMLRLAGMDPEEFIMLTLADQPELPFSE